MQRKSVDHGSIVRFRSQFQMTGSSSCLSVARIIKSSLFLENPTRHLVPAKETEQLEVMA
jgi:hypothetical protein